MTVQNRYYTQPDGSVVIQDAVTGKVTVTNPPARLSAAPPEGFIDRARQGLTSGLQRTGLSPYMARRTSEGILGRPFARSQSEIPFLETLGVANATPVVAGGLMAGEAFTQAAQGNRGAALGNAALSILDIGGSGAGLKAAYRNARQSPELVDIPQTPEGRKYFQGILAEAQDSQGPLGYQVSVYEPEAYKGMSMTASPNADAGYAISPKGEIVSLVKNKDSEMKGFAGKALMRAEDDGGVFLNAFDTELTNLYGKAGFKPVSRVEFDEEMFRDQIGDEAVDEFMKANARFNEGRPDLVFMVRDPEFTPKAMSGQGGQKAEYDEAYDILLREMNRLGYND